MRAYFQILIFILGLFLSTDLHAQQTYRITGSVSGGKNTLENISTSLHSLKDSAVVKIELTSRSGNFAFEHVSNGAYFISFSGIGFTSYSSAPIVISDKNYELANVQLQATAKQLSEVSVVVKKPLLEMKADKMVMNVDASPSNAGNTALELLEKAPGVLVDKDGNISLKGKQGVTVLIDGRPTYLGGANLANMLKSMSASQLEQVEIITNPSAKFDASGNSGIINIKTKKSKTVGFNGNVNINYAQGIYPKTNGGFNINYRRNKFNLFSSLNYAYRAGFQEIEIYRSVINKNTNVQAFGFNQRAYMPDSRKVASGKFGLDYDISSNTSAAFTMNLADTRMKYDNKLVNHISDEHNDLTTVNLGETRMRPHVKNSNYNINLRHKLDSAGSEINIDGSYVRFKDDHKQSFYNSFFDNTGRLMSKADTLAGHLPTGFDIYAVKADFTKSFSKKRTLDAGIKASFVHSDNDVKFDSIINGNRVKDISRTNHFIYDENVYAAYVSYAMPLGKKFRIQSGLRYEYTNGKGRSITNNTTNQKNYGEFFPTLYISYEANEKNAFNINYGRRITRPQYNDMNPFIFIIDRYTFQKGNPYLQPQFSNNIELSHTYNQFLTTTFNVSQTDEVISEIIETDEISREATIIKKNIAMQQQAGLAINFYKPLNKWLTINANMNLFRNRFKGIVNDTAIDISRNSGRFFAALQFKLNKGWDAEVNGFYNAKGIDGITMDGSMYMFTLAASKSIIKGKGKISLSVRDPFAMMKYNGVTKFSTVNAVVTNRWDNRTVNLGFNYRFGKQFKTNKRSEGGAAEEQGRIGK